MIDISDTLKPKSDQLNADDLIAGSITIKVRDVKRGTSDSGNDQPVWIYYEGDNNKPFKPCLTMRRVLAYCWGADASKWVGRSMTLYRDEAVTFGADITGGIRISHLSDIGEKKTMAVTAKRGKRKPYVVMPLAVKSAPTETRETLLPAAQEEAKKGTAALQAHWKAIGRSRQELLQGDLAELKTIAAAHDAPIIADDEELPL